MPGELSSAPATTTDKTVSTLPLPNFLREGYHWAVNGETTLRGKDTIAAYQMAHAEIIGIYEQSKSTLPPTIGDLIESFKATSVADTVIKISIKTPDNVIERYTSGRKGSFIPRVDFILQELVKATRLDGALDLNKILSQLIISIGMEIAQKDNVSQAQVQEEMLTFVQNILSKLLAIDQIRNQLHPNMVTAIRNIITYLSKTFDPSAHVEQAIQTALGGCITQPRDMAQLLLRAILICTEGGAKSEEELLFSPQHIANEFQFTADNPFQSVIQGLASICEHPNADNRPPIAVIIPTIDQITAYLMTSNSITHAATAHICRHSVLYPFVQKIVDGKAVWATAEDTMCFAKSAGFLYQMVMYTVFLLAASDLAADLKLFIHAAAFGQSATRRLDPQEIKLFGEGMGQFLGTFNLGIKNLCDFIRDHVKATSYQRTHNILEILNQISTRIDGMKRQSTCLLEQAPVLAQQTISKAERRIVGFEQRAILFQQGTVGLLSGGSSSAYLPGSSEAAGVLGFAADPSRGSASFVVGGRPGVFQETFEGLPLATPPAVADESLLMQKPSASTTVHMPSSPQQKETISGYKIAIPTFILALLTFPILVPLMSMNIIALPALFASVVGGPWVFAAVIAASILLAGFFIYLALKNQGSENGQRPQYPETPSTQDVPLSVPVSSTVVPQQPAPPALPIQEAVASLPTSPPPEPVVIAISPLAAPVLQSVLQRYLELTNNVAVTQKDMFDAINTIVKERKAEPIVVATELLSAKKDWSPLATQWMQVYMQKSSEVLLAQPAMGA